MSLNPETYPQDEDGFENCVKKFYTKYSSQVNTRDILIKSLRSKRVLKPDDISEDEHQERIENLCRYANKLHGTRAPLAEGDKLDILFEIFQQKWKTSFILIGKIPTNSNESVIIEFMKIAKGIADADDSKRKEENRL